MDCKNPPRTLIGAEIGIPLSPIFGVEGGVAVETSRGPRGRLGAFGGGSVGPGGKVTVCQYKLLSNTVIGVVDDEHF